MSVTEVENIISKMSSSDDWEIYAVKYKHTKRNGSIYGATKINFRKREDLLEYINTIQDEYCYKRLKQYENICKYDGSCNSSLIYFLKQTNNLIAQELILLNQSLSNSCTGTNIVENINDENAFVIQGTIEDYSGKEQLVKFVTLRSPYTLLKNRFIYEDGEYAKINEKVLTLWNAFDVIIMGDEKVYFMNLNGEKLFNMERAYKGICSEKIDEIGKFDILSDFELFSQSAMSGHNPRKFVSYDHKNLKYVTDIKNRKEIAKKFKIKLDNKDKIDTSDAVNVEKFVKFLCDRAVLDPVNKEPRESDGTRKWT